VTILVVNNSLIEKRWAIIAIFMGIIVGFISAFLCIYYNLVIFGFNIMYIISPLMAGFVETIIARRKYGKSTGAISAILTFILINLWGWFFLGLVTNDPVAFNLITIIAIVLTIQAAFPILMNYVLFVIGLSIIRKIIETLIYIPSKIQRKPPEVEVENEINMPSADEIFLDELTIPLVSIPQIENGKIKSTVGLVTGEAIAKEKETEGLLSKLTSIIQPIKMEDIYLGEARKDAISRMLENAKLIGANSVVEVMVGYVSIGGLQGNAFIVTATGTAVIYE
jgi:uncharacterized protein YbjQ (UPF0145 family)